MKDVSSLYEKLYSEMGDLGWWPGNSRDEVIIGAILTQNTSWSNVEKALTALRSQDLINIAKITAMKKEELSTLIRSSGFHNQKAERLIDLSRNIIENYGSLSDLSLFPQDEISAFLGSIKGVGQETRDAILLYALEKPVFVVDKYTMRIFLRVGIIRSEDEMNALKGSIPDHDGMTVEKLKNLHGMIVQLAKEHCRKKPLCEDCPLRSDCRYYTEVMLP